MKYFTISELCRSDAAVKKGIGNLPDGDAVACLQRLVEKVLDPAREWLGAPVTVTSGYRCGELNRAVGGSPTSQHMKGEAADLVCKDNKRLFDLIRDRLEFDQLIWENGGQWVHVSYSREKNRKQILNLG